ncbi:hydroxymethylglutaryl-CoA lyase [Luminiphilus sp.]|nr:hydroxymethylglutaryl-CoA lyase [Luminiphilus sp.]MDC1160767.1 hydroxymethylglutaryl-CoA lyase [Luminiphilus sp.]
MKHITISEVGPRDGLQSVETTLSTEAKLAWIEAEYAAGVREIEVGSFVSPKLLPQMADTEAVVRGAQHLEGLIVAVLVPNVRGFESALRAGAHKISVPLSLSETHSLKNVRRTHAQMLDEIRSCLKLVEAMPESEKPVFEVGLSTAFGCTLEGVVPESFVVEMAERVLDLGVAEVGLSDTTGMGNPAQLERLLTGIWQRCGESRLTGVHLHNTRGQGLANALRAVELGITTLDSSLGGLGGCPFAPGASGNIVTEDLVFMLQSMGYPTGIDLEALLVVRQQVAELLPEEEWFGFTAAAGLPKHFGAATLQ